MSAIINFLYKRKKLPILSLISFLQDPNPLEVHLAPTGRELVQALRALLLQAHWHTYTILADSPAATALQRGELWSTLSASPLHPTLIALPSPHRPQSTFR